MMTGLLANLPTDLAFTDVGFIYVAADYAHIYIWGGTGWTYAPGDSGSGYYQAWSETPTAGVWNICDGSTVVRSKADGTTANVTLPNLTGIPAYLRSNAIAALTGLPVAAISPTVVTPANTGGSTATISGATATESAHTHSVDPPSTASSIPSGTNNYYTNVGIDGPLSDMSHTHTTDIAAFTSGTGSAHSHAVGTLATDSHTHSIAAVTVATDGHPRHLDVAVYYRL